MSATSALESNEDLDNIPLVRMEDVQPDRSEMYIVKNKDPLDLDICVEDYNDEENANIGTMVFIKSEEIIRLEEGNRPEVVVPDLPKAVPLTIIVERAEAKQNPESWPILEILPGGVINHTEKHDLLSPYQSGGENENDDENLMYACAKCPQRFKFLVHLVKHVKWHENPELRRKKLVDKKFIGLRTKKKRVIHKLKTKCKVPKKF